MTDTPSQEDFRKLVAAVATELFKLFDDVGVSPCHEVTMATGLMYASAAKAAGMTKEAVLEAIGDAYDYSELYLEGKGPTE